MLGEFKAGPRLLTTQCPYISLLEGEGTLTLPCCPSSCTSQPYRTAIPYGGAGESRRGRQIEATNRICSSNTDSTCRCCQCDATV
jgi:hypothetical protein